MLKNLVVPAVLATLAASVYAVYRRTGQRSPRDGEDIAKGMSEHAGWSSQQNRGALSAGDDSTSTQRERLGSGDSSSELLMPGVS